MHSGSRVEGNAGQAGDRQVVHKHIAIGTTWQQEQHCRVNDIEQDRMVAGQGQSRVEGMASGQNRVDGTG